MTRVLVSSTNSKVWESLLIIFGKSLMYILNSKSPRIEPCKHHTEQFLNPRSRSVFL